MSLTNFLQKIVNNEDISFEETIAMISSHYNYHATEFSNGIDVNKLTNQAGTNEGSCKIFYFAKINQLTQQQTLHLFGHFYYKDVIQNPDATSHQNIRNFMQYGWDGIIFAQVALSNK